MEKNLILIIIENNPEIDIFQAEKDIPQRAKQL